jgi:hypothetical protein
MKKQLLLGQSGAQKFIKKQLLLGQSGAQKTNSFFLAKVAHEC